MHIHHKFCARFTSLDIKSSECCNCIESPEYLEADMAAQWFWPWAVEINKFVKIWFGTGVAIVKVVTAWLLPCWQIIEKSSFDGKEGILSLLPTADTSQHRWVEGISPSELITQNYFKVLCLCKQLLIGTFCSSTYIKKVFFSEYHSFCLLLTEYIDGVTCYLKELSYDRVYQP